jgi:hypothetical protein
MEGFQLWLNLPADQKMREPWYRDIESVDIPELKRPGLKVRVIAGHSGGVTGAVQRERTEPLILDVHLEPGERFEQPLPAGHNVFVYVYRGALQVVDTPVPAQRMALLANTTGSDGVVLQNSGDAPARALLIAGRPLNEPIAQYGPFVMNSHEQIVQAVEDFRAGRLA